MAPRKKKAVAGDESVVVLETHVGQPLVIRANPSDEAVRGFVEEHTRRYIAGEAGGPSGIPPFRIYTAKRYADELAFLDGEDPVEDVEIADLLPTP